MNYKIYTNKGLMSVKCRRVEKVVILTIKDDFQSVLRTVESLFSSFVLLHVGHHKNVKSPN